MYESYWQLKQKPFDNATDPRFYYPGESHQAALLKLRYVVENRRGGALLTGVSGSGKTLLANMLRQSMGDNVQPFVRMVFPQMPCHELLAYLADQLMGLDRTLREPNIQQSVWRIEQFLAENSRQGRHAVVIVDEAHLVADSPTLEALRLLLNFESGGEPPLSLILAGQTALLPTLDRTPQLEERLGVKCLVRPLTEKETAEYVAHRMKVAGATQTIFEPDAMPTLHALTHGVARRINRLCDLALLIGFAEERKTLGVSHLESVSQELVAVVPE